MHQQGASVRETSGAAAVRHAAGLPQASVETDLFAFSALQSAGHHIPEAAMVTV